MGRIRYTSDLHFAHPYIAGLRGFSPVADEKGEVRGDPAEHDGVITENFNKGIRDDDITIIAGDFALNWKNAADRLALLRGRKILVEGNHDIMSSVHRDGWKHQAAWTGPGRFEAILAFMRRRTAGEDILISHYPYEGEGDRGIPERYTQFRLKDQGMWLIHGHTHSKRKRSDNPREIHAGVDAWDLSPVPEEAVIAIMRGES
jgi:calcineurin-like phosphoesterase family protein